jgi:hypothetical protein
LLYGLEHCDCAISEQPQMIVAHPDKKGRGSGGEFALLLL